MKSSKEIKQTAYQSIKSQLDNAFSKGGIPNIKAFKRIIVDLKKRIKLLESGTEFFATSMEDVEKAEFQIARLTGQLDAYKERYDFIQRKLKENSIY